MIVVKGVQRQQLVYVVYIVYVVHVVSGDGLKVRGFKGPAKAEFPVFNVIIFVNHSLRPLPSSRQLAERRKISSILSNLHVLEVPQGGIQGVVFVSGYNTFYCKTLM
jgi:hypothetical protein